MRLNMGIARQSESVEQYADARNALINRHKCVYFLQEYSESDSNSGFSTPDELSKPMIDLPMGSSQFGLALQSFTLIRRVRFHWRLGNIRPVIGHL
ncbi:MAG: hypothetical protein ABJ018_10410 [Paracoccaceae bacterium]